MLENELDEVSVELISTKGLTKDLINGYSILKGAKYFFQVYYKITKYLYQLINTLTIVLVSKKGMSEESIKNPSNSNNNFAPSLINSYPLPDIKFSGNCLANSNIFVFRKVMNLHISYKLETWWRDLIHISH